MVAVDGVEDLYMQGGEGGFKGTFTTLYGCLFEDGNCRTLLGMGTALGTLPQLLHQHLQGVKRAGVREGGGEYYGRAERGLALRAREQGRDPGLERSHRARKAYELWRFRCIHGDGCTIFPLWSLASREIMGRWRRGWGSSPAPRVAWAAATATSGTPQGRVRRWRRRVAGEGRDRRVRGGLVATALRRHTGGAERAARRERRDGEGGERSNEGARGLRGPGKERAGSARTWRHRQGGVAGAMRVR